MKRCTFLLFPLFIATLGAMTACKPDPETQPSQAKPASNSGIPAVYVTNYPLAYFAERIGGHEVKVVFPVPGDVDPAFWEPIEKEIEAYQSADLILLNGASYSKWLETVTLPDSKTVNTSSGFSDKFIVVKDAITHSHGKAGEHSHSGTAFTTWIDFNQALSQADAIREAFQQLRPEHMELFALNYDQLKNDLLALDNAMKAEGERLANQPVVASHPIYQYWARRYGINLQAVLWEPGTVPDEAQLEALKKILATHPAKWMIWEGEPDPVSVTKLKELGINSAVFDPCANVPGNGTWLDVMKKNVEAMKTVK